MAPSGTRSASDLKAGSVGCWYQSRAARRLGRLPSGIWHDHRAEGPDGSADLDGPAVLGASRTPCTGHYVQVAPLPEDDARAGQPG